MKYCSKCNSIINEEHKFCTNCGTKVVESDEETIINNSENNSNKKETIQKYEKIGGFLIFVGISLVLGLITTFSLFNENYTNEYYESMAIIYKNYYELFILLNISYYLILICLFLLILLNISFFTKSDITKKLAIIYFTLLIITDVYVVFIFSNNKEVMSKLSVEIIKIGFQVISALFFIVYFSISKRVKETFIVKKNLELHIAISIILPIILFFYYSSKLDEIKNKIPSINSSISVPNETTSSESNYSIKKDHSTDDIVQKSSATTQKKKQEDTNKNSFQTIFEYKDWKYESFDNFFRIITNGKVGATGHEFGIIQSKEQCNNNYIWLTFSTISDVSPYLGENVKFKISIDKNTFYNDLPIFNVTKVSPSLNIVTFSNSLLNEYSIASFKKGKKLKVEILKTDKLYDKFDIKFEEFSLEGFVATYMKLDEKCSNSSNKILFEYVQNNDYGASGLDRTYKLTKNGKSCIFNYIAGSYNVVINDSCTGESKFKVRDDNGNFIQNDDNHWSPLPYHDAFRLMTGNEMKVNQKMMSKFNSKNELIYCLEDMSICKTEKEVKTNSDFKKIDTTKKTFSSLESTPKYSDSYTTTNTKPFESAFSEQECYNKGMYPSKHYSDGSVLCTAEHTSSVEYIQPSKKPFESAFSEQECYNKGMYPSKHYSDGSVLCTADGSLP